MKHHPAEHEKKHMPPHMMKKHAHGGATGPGEDEMKREKEEAEESQKRKRGGRVHGGKSMHRPDRRARGGATSDASPLTSAGKMSAPSYESGNAKNDTSSGSGPDKD